MIKYDISKDLNIILWFSDVVTPSIFKNNLRIIEGSKPKKVITNEALKENLFLKKIEINLKLKIAYINRSR